MTDATTKPYELVALQWDEVISKPGDPLDFVRHAQGEVVQLDRPTARRLLDAGAVVEPGSRERALADLLKAQLDAAIAAMPEDVRAAYAHTQPGTDQQVAAVTGATGTPGAPERPSRAASKDAWVDYCVARGTAREIAEGLGRDALIELYPEG